MGFEYINADRSLRKSNRARLRLKKPSDASRRTHGCADSGASREGSGLGGDRVWTDIEFQFPPKVLTDGRKAAWEEGDQVGTEPIATFSTSGPREISLSWVYVVDSFEANSDAWSIDRITRNIRTLRGYFASVRDRGEAGTVRANLVVMFHMWCIGGDNPISARLRGVDVRYGDTMVFPPQGGLSDRAFPLRTDITVDLRVWTRGAGVEEHRREFGIQDIPGLSDTEPPSWY